ncbi:helix-turn-helix domain-containing protein [Nocardia sp. CA-107356]|uniref:helix-turn-helix domain-containing protein n=1 Tax=Nocardia sp. CA-107356 TaxID=3239972 RepID=UPI003D8E7288
MLLAKGPKISVPDATIIDLRLRYNFRRHPTPGRQQSLSRAFGCARVVFNDALVARKCAYKYGKYVTDVELSQALTREGAARFQ